MRFTLPALLVCARASHTLQLPRLVMHLFGHAPTTLHLQLPATVEFVDIAGLVSGASKGEGLGNKFLATIRETDAICQVVRCFENDDIIHVEGDVNPVRDLDIISNELRLKDLEMLNQHIVGSFERSLHLIFQDTAEKVLKRTNDKDVTEELATLNKIKDLLTASKDVRSGEWNVEEGCQCQHHRNSRCRSRYSTSTSS